MPLPLAAFAIPAIASGVQALFGFFGGKSANKSGDRAAQLQYSAAMRAAQLQADAEARQLAFLKETETARQREWQMTQDRNRAIYDSETAQEQGRYNDLQARMQPYRQFGGGAIGQLSRPIPRGMPGSLGARMGG
jgi:hypothetical protein